MSVLFAGVKEHDILACTANVTDVFKNIVCLMSDSDDYPLISAKLPILTDACFLIIFQEQSKETIERKEKQNKWKKKQRMKEKRVIKRKQSKRKFAKKMRQTRAQIKGDELEKKRNKTKSERNSPPSFSFNEDLFSTNNCPPINLKCCSRSEKSAIIKEFDTLTSDIGFNHCYCCKRVAINLCMVSRSTEAVCSDCKAHRNFDPIQENLLPVWFSADGQAMYHVPNELSCLREGEKLLIQMVSPYVPFLHIKNGTLGIKGHVCSFPQRVQDLYTTLPRLPNSATFVKMVRSFKGEEGEFGVKSFFVRRAAILHALNWLKKYNQIYKQSVTINESNLDWMDGAEEAELPSTDVVAPEKEENLHSSFNDRGPAEAQCQPPMGCDELDELKTCGIHVEDASPLMSEEDNELRDVIKVGTESVPSLPWPYVSSDPVNEYDTTEKIFCKAFPWLFPGGVGDFNDYRERKISATDWVARMLQYEDGRFASDKMWCFFALNYSTRRRNQTSGRFFVDGFDKDAPESMDELKDRLRKGDTTFIDKITYYSQRVRGSSSYWRSRRAELYSWINHHVKEGNGMPNFFITLSCAEYFWPDGLRLLNERLKIAGHADAVSTNFIMHYSALFFQSVKNRRSAEFNGSGKNNT